MVNFSASGAASDKAGAEVSLDIPEAAWTRWASGAAASINTATRYNWSDNFATLNTDVKWILEDVSSSMVAMNAINYDMSGYTSRYEAETMLDVQNENIIRNISILRNIKSQTFILGA